MKKFEVVADKFRHFPDENIKLPERKTKFSAGYDFYLPSDIHIKAGGTVLIHTDIKVRMDYREVFKMYIRSSVGIKNNVCFANIVPVIDADYYDNESTGGNIIMALYNYGKDPVIFKKGDAIAQGIFESYAITDDDHVMTARVGGIGSTNGK